MSAIKTKRVIICLALTLCVALSLFAVLHVPTEAAVTMSDGAGFNSTTYYKMQQSIPQHTDHTIEVEFFLDPTMSNDTRPGVIIGNWHNSNVDNTEWSVEIHKNGNVRLFHVTGGSIFFNPVNVGDFSNGNVGTPTDVRTHMGTAANPKFAKMSVTVNSTSGEASLYIDGKWLMTVGPSGSSYLDNNGNRIENTSLKSSAVLGRTYTVSSKNPYHVIGGDNRTNTGDDFMGRIKNISLYSDVRTADEIAAYASADSFAAYAESNKNSDLVFAYDLDTSLKVNEGYLTDLSSSNIQAINPNWTVSGGRAFTKNDYLTLIKPITVVPKTFEAVIYAPKSYDRVGVIFGNYNNGRTCDINFELHTSANGPTLNINNVSTTTKKDVRSNYGWVHIVMVKNDATSEWSLYIDGVKASTVAQAGSWAPDENTLLTMQETYPFRLGRDSRGKDDDQYFKGKIKQVALYEGALTDAEIKNSYLAGGGAGNDSIILNYDLTNLESNDYVYDTTGNGYHVTQNKAAIETLIPGTSFTDKDNFQLSSKLTKQAMTYEATVFLPESVTGRAGVIFGNYLRFTDSAINFEISDGGVPRFFALSEAKRTDNNNKYDTSILFSNCDIRGSWAHVVITQDNSGDTATFKCYINGSLAQTVTGIDKSKVTFADMSTLQSISPFAIGRDDRKDFTNYFKGKIKQIALYDKTLTES